MGIVGRDKCLDDCAIFPCGEQVMVATTDMLHRTTDFVPGMTDWQAGWMSAAVTLSDIASMGAAPKYLLIAVGLDDWKSLAGVMQGAKDCCTRYGAEIIGGDIDRHGELTVVTPGSAWSTDRTLSGGPGHCRAICLYHRDLRGRHRHGWTAITSSRRRSSNRSPALRRGRSSGGPG